MTAIPTRAREKGKARGKEIKAPALLKQSPNESKPVLTFVGAGFLIANHPRIHLESEAEKG